MRTSCLREPISFLNASAISFISRSTRVRPCSNECKARLRTQLPTLSILPTNLIFLSPPFSLRSTHPRRPPPLPMPSYLHLTAHEYSLLQVRGQAAEKARPVPHGDPVLSPVLGGQRQRRKTLPRPTPRARVPAEVGVKKEKMIHMQRSISLYYFLFWCVLAFVTSNKYGPCSRLLFIASFVLTLILLWHVGVNNTFE